jgi:hypothetical protein
MLARVPDVRSELESEGNVTAKITENWICKIDQCNNYGHLCFWGVRDRPEYHLPVHGVHLQAWATAIDRGELTPDDPGQSILQQMMKHHARRSVSTKKSPAAALPSAPASTHFSFAFTDQGNSSSAMEASAARPAVSSPLRMPLTQSSAVELREEFLRWCKDDVSWRSEHTRLGQMQLLLDEAGFDLEGIAECSVKTWKEAGLPVAYRGMMKKAAKRWLFERGARCRSICSDDESLDR